MKSFWTNPTMFWGAGTLLLRTSRSGTDALLHALLQEMQTAVRGVNGSIPLAPSTMADLCRRAMARTCFTLVLLSVAGLMALLLGIVGIYSVEATKSVETFFAKPRRPACPALLRDRRHFWF
jgi:hypothetical protein